LYEWYYVLLLLCHTRTVYCQDIFALGDDLEVEFVAIMLVALMIFSMCCVFILEKLREVTECWKHYRAVMEKVIEELAILGLISFGLTMLERYLLFHLSNGTNEDNC
jgi:hypothetical protein